MVTLSDVGAVTIGDVCHSGGLGVTSATAVAKPRPAPPNPPAARTAPVRAGGTKAGRPLTIGIIGFPVFWALGLGEFVWLIVSMPMLYRLWSRPHRVRVPPFFGLWMAYLVWADRGRRHDRHPPAGHPRDQRGIRRLGCAGRESAGRHGRAAVPGQPDRGRDAHAQGRPVAGLLLRHRRGRGTARDVLRQLQLHLPAGDDPAARVALDVLRPAAGSSRLCAGSGHPRHDHAVTTPEGAVRLHQQLGQQHRPAADLVRRRRLDPGIAHVEDVHRTAARVVGDPDHLLAEPRRLDRTRHLAAFPRVSARPARQVQPHRRHPGDRRPCRRPVHRHAR